MRAATSAKGWRLQSDRRKRPKDEKHTAEQEYAEKKRQERERRCVQKRGREEMIADPLVVEEISDGNETDASGCAGELQRTLITRKGKRHSKSQGFDNDTSMQTCRLPRRRGVTQNHEAARRKQLLVSSSQSGTQPTGQREVSSSVTDLSREQRQTRHRMLSREHARSTTTRQS